MREPCDGTRSTFPPAVGGQFRCWHPPSGTLVNEVPPGNAAWHKFIYLSLIRVGIVGNFDCEFCGNLVVRDVGGCPKRPVGVPLLLALAELLCVMQSQGAARSSENREGCVCGRRFPGCEWLEVRMTSLLQGERPELHSGYCPRIHFLSHGFCASARDLQAAPRT